MDEAGFGSTSGGEDAGVAGMHAAHAQPFASEDSPTSDDANNFDEPDIAVDDQPQIETMMANDESRHRANDGDDDAEHHAPRPEDSLNDSGGSSIGYGLPPRGSVGSGGSAAARDDSTASAAGAACDTAAADEDTASHGHRGRDSLSGSASVGGASSGCGIDESLLVSPILTDYFAGAGGEGKKSRPRTDEKEDKKPQPQPPKQQEEEEGIDLEKELPDQATTARELDMSGGAAGQDQEQEEKKDDDGGIDMPDEEGGQPAVAGVNLGQQLQLDTSMCPSLGLGSAGSDVHDEGESEPQTSTEEGTSTTNEPTLMAIPETIGIGIEADCTFETVDEAVRETQAGDVNDDSNISMKADLELANANQNEEGEEEEEEEVTDTNNVYGASAEPVIEQTLDIEAAQKEEGEESLLVPENVGFSVPEPSSLVVKGVNMSGTAEANDADRSDDEIKLKDAHGTDDGSPLVDTNNAASDEPILGERDGVLGDNSGMVGKPAIDEPLECSLSPITRHTSTSPVPKQSLVGAGVQDTNQSLDVSGETSENDDEEEEGKEDARADVPMEEEASAAEPSVHHELQPAPSVNQHEMDHQDDHLVDEAAIFSHMHPSAEETAVHVASSLPTETASTIRFDVPNDGGDDSPSQLAAASNTNDDSLSALFSPPIMQPSTTSEDALALAGPSPGNDLSSAKKKLGASSHALVERLRGAAQKRKQLVTKSRDSFVAKEQKQKLSLENIALSSHAEEEEYEEEHEPVASDLVRPVATQKRQFEGINPVKPFKARPLPVTTGDLGHGGQTGVPKVAKRSPTVPSSPLLGNRRRLKEGDVGESRAYQRVKEEERRRREASAGTTTMKKTSPSPAAASRKPASREKERGGSFKARPLPATTGELGQGGQTGVPKVAKRSPTVPSSPLLGFRRPAFSASQPSKAYQTVAKEAKASIAASSSQKPRNESSVSSVKPSALRAQPFDRLLSGSEASRVKEATLKEQRERQEAEARHKSNFRARPLPATTAPSSSYSTPSPNLFGLDLVSSQCKQPDSGRAKASYPGEENFTPTNEMQPSAESPTKKQRTEPSTSSYPDRLHSTIRARKRAEYEAQRLAHDQERQEREAQQRKQVIRRTNQELDDLKDRI